MLPRRRVVPAQLRDEPGAQEVLVVLVGEPGPLSGGGAVDPGSLVGGEAGQRCSTEDMAQRAGVQVPGQDVQRIHPQGLFVPQAGAGEPVRRVITELTDRHGAYGGGRVLTGGARQYRGEEAVAVTGHAQHVESGPPGARGDPPGHRALRGRFR